MHVKNCGSFSFTIISGGDYNHMLLPTFAARVGVEPVD
jgi:hypothetical protein